MLELEKPPLLHNDMQVLTLDSFRMFAEGEAGTALPAPSLN
jgi:hypothetical protein